MGPGEIRSSGESSDASSSSKRTHDMLRKISSGRSSDKSGSRSQEEIDRLKKSWREVSSTDDLEFTRMPKKIVREKEDVSRGSADAAWGRLRKSWGGRDHRSVRVDQLANKIDEDLAKIHEVFNRSDNTSGLADDLKRAIDEKVTALVQDIETSYRQALQNYGRGSEGRGTRNWGEAKLKELRDEMGAIKEDIEKMQQAHQNLCETQDAAERYVPEAYRRNVREWAQAIYEHAQTNFKQGIENYQPKEGCFHPDKEQFDHGCRWLAARPEELKAVCEQHITSITEAIDEQFSTARSIIKKVEDASMPMGNLKDKFTRVCQQYDISLYESKTNDSFTPNEWRQELERHLEAFNGLAVEVRNILKDKMNNVVKYNISYTEQIYIEEEYEKSINHSRHGEWEKHERLHETILVSLGHRDENIAGLPGTDEYQQRIVQLHTGTDEYQQRIVQLRTKFETSLKEGKLGEAHECIKQFASETEAFENYLGEHGWLEGRPHRAMRSGELSGDVTRRGEELVNEMRACKATLDDLQSKQELTDKEKLAISSDEVQQNLQKKLEDTLHEFKNIYNNPENWLQQGEASSEEHTEKLQNLHDTFQELCEALDSVLYKHIDNLHKELSDSQENYQIMYLPSEVKERLERQIQSLVKSLYKQYKAIEHDYIDNYTVHKDKVAEYIENNEKLRNKSEVIDWLHYVYIHRLHNESKDILQNVQEKLDEGSVPEELGRKLESNVQDLVRSLDEQQAAIEQEYTTNSTVDKAKVAKFIETHEQLPTKSESIDTSLYKYIDNLHKKSDDTLQAMQAMQEKLNDGSALKKLGSKLESNIQNLVRSLDEQQAAIEQEYTTNSTVNRDELVRYSELHDQLQKQHEDLDGLCDVHDLRSKSIDIAQAIQEKLDDDSVPAALRKEAEENIQSLADSLRDQYFAIVRDYRTNSTLNRDEITKYSQLCDKMQEKNKDLDNLCYIHDTYSKSKNILQDVQKKRDKGYISEEQGEVLEKNIQRLVRSLKRQHAVIRKDYARNSIVDEAKLARFIELDNKLQDRNESFNRFNDTMKYIQKKQTKGSIPEIFKSLFDSKVEHLSNSFKDGFYTERARDIHRQLEDVNKVIDEWHQFSQDSAVLEKTINDYVPKEYMSLAHNLAKNDRFTARDAIEKFLDVSHPESDQQHGRVVFKEAWQQSKDRMADLQKICHDQIDTITKQFGKQYEYFDNITARLLKEESSNDKYALLEQFRESYRGAWAQYEDEWKQYEKEWRRGDTNPTQTPDQWRQRFASFAERLDAEFEKIHPQEATYRIKQEFEKHVMAYEHLAACFSEREIERSHEHPISHYINDLAEARDDFLFLQGEGDFARAEERAKDFALKLRECETFLRESKWLNGDTSPEMFQRSFKTDITEYEDDDGIQFIAHSKEKIGEGSYTTIINLDKGKITTSVNGESNTEHWQHQKVVEEQAQLIIQEAGMDSSQFHLKGWYDKDIRDEETKAIAERFLPAGKAQRTFEAGSAEFNDIAQTSSAQWKLAILDSHIDVAGDKDTIKIVVQRQSDGSIDINYEAHEITPAQMEDRGWSRSPERARGSEEGQGADHGVVGTPEHASGNNEIQGADYGVANSLERASGSNEREGADHGVVSSPERARGSEEGQGDYARISSDGEHEIQQEGHQDGEDAKSLRDNSEALQITKGVRKDKKDSLERKMLTVQGRLTSSDGQHQKSDKKTVATQVVTFLKSAYRLLPVSIKKTTFRPNMEKKRRKIDVPSSSAKPTKSIFKDVDKSTEAKASDLGSAHRKKLVWRDHEGGDLEHFSGTAEYGAEQGSEDEFENMERSQPKLDSIDERIASTNTLMNEITNKAKNQAIPYELENRIVNMINSSAKDYSKYYEKLANSHGDESDRLSQEEVEKSIGELDKRMEGIDGAINPLKTSWMKIYECQLTIRKILDFMTKESTHDSMRLDDRVREKIDQKIGQEVDIAVQASEQLIKKSQHGKDWSGDNKRLEQVRAKFEAIRDVFMRWNGLQNSSARLASVPDMFPGNDWSGFRNRIEEDMDIARKDFKKCIGGYQNGKPWLGHKERFDDISYHIETIGANLTNIKGVRDKMSQIEEHLNSGEKEQKIEIASEHVGRANEAFMQCLAGYQQGNDYSGHAEGIVKAFDQLNEILKEVTDESSLRSLELEFD